MLGFGLIGVGVALVLLYYIADWLRAWSMQRKARTWTPTQGRVESWQIEERYRKGEDGGRYFILEAFYSFPVGGHLYSGAYEERFSSEGDAETRLEQLR